MEKTKCEKSRSTSSQGLLEVDEREGRLRQMRSVHRASIIFPPKCERAFIRHTFLTLFSWARASGLCVLAGSPPA